MKSGFFENINETGKPLAKLIKRHSEWNKINHVESKKKTLQQIFGNFRES